MLNLKGCARCGGDQQHGYDIQGFNYLGCLQCGHRVYLDNGRVTQEDANVVTMDVIESALGLQLRSGSRLA